MAGLHQDDTSYYLHVQYLVPKVFYSFAAPFQVYWKYCTALFPTRCLAGRPIPMMDRWFTAYWSAHTGAYTDGREDPPHRPAALCAAYRGPAERLGDTPQIRPGHAHFRPRGRYYAAY
jgi:hypothetical protein